MGCQADALLYVMYVLAWGRAEDGRAWANLHYLSCAFALYQRIPVSNNSQLSEASRSCPT